MSQVKRSFETLNAAFNKEINTYVSNEGTRSTDDAHRQKIATDPYWQGRVDGARPAFTGDVNKAASSTVHETPRGPIHVVNPTAPDMGYMPTSAALNFPMLGQETYKARRQPPRTKY